jgi:dihydroorotase
MSDGGVMHAGPTCKKLGLPGWDPRAEEAMIERDIKLLRDIGGRYHVAHISTAKSADLIRRAKVEGLGITAEICPHHLLLCDEDCAGGDPNFKMNPPLRSRDDVAACRAALADGTIDCIVTDHAPHTFEEKSAGFLNAPFGIVGLETSLATSIEAMITTGLMDWPGLIDRMTRIPARVLNLNCGSLTPDGPADVCIIDPDAEWIVDPDRFASKGRNTPFAGRSLNGAVVATLLAGKMTYLNDAYRERFQ